jgi:SM-20-related protein
VQPDGLPADVALALMTYAAMTDDENFHVAGVGRGTDQQRNKFVRRDRIHWLDERDPTLAPESHLAHYGPGDFYRTHVDAFKGEANRIVSLACYLNEDWTEGDGGELVLHTKLGEIAVQPVHRTVVLFLSEEIPHEVKPARRDRYSVTGWFRLNSSGPDRVDPPR